MKTIKLMFLICIACSFTQCSTMKLTEKAPFTITGATYNNWVGGQPGVGGTNLIIGIANNENITFTSVYFRNKKIKTSVERRNKKNYLVVNLNKAEKEIRVLGYSRQVVSGSGKNISENNKVKTTIIENKTPPIPFKLKVNEAVICYKVNNKYFYYKVSNIKKTETIFYP